MATHNAFDPPPGFPMCPVCPYLQSGPVYICVQCAGQVVGPIAEPHCPICAQALNPGGLCRNRLCRAAGRQIERINAIATFDGELAEKIRRLKYDGKWGWARIFGRLVTGWLNDHRDSDEVDAIVANPTFPVYDAVQHTEVVLREAEREDVLARWAFRPDLLTLAQPLTSSAGRSAADKVVKADELYSVLRIADRAEIAGGHVVVYDDVCTTGSQLEAVARFLRKQGAASVEGLVLARAPWR